MNRLLKKMLPGLLILLISCELYHPDLISRKESEKRISQACIANLFARFGVPGETTSTAAASSVFEQKAAGDAAYLCNYDNHIYTVKDEMVRISDTEACVKAVAFMPGPAYSDIIVQYAVVRNIVCDIKAVRFLEFTEPGQGGI